ncbi:MAG TPA: GreA/GreB family elongation factor, partial [Bacteroidales bacterium]|nr:GreA/GreB family elongation factor [Bacteroidales bacterium]
GGQPQGEVRFGAIVTIKAEATGKIQTFRIVGVDEADISKAKIPFISPFSKALMNKKVGDKTILRQTGKDIAFEIIDIKYN